MSILKKATRQSLIVALFACNTLFASAQTTTLEYQIKAVFLFNFTQFVEWPSSSFASPQAPFVIGVLGENPFGGYLQEIVSGEKINGHPLVIEYYKDASEVKDCHILFITLNETEIEQATSKLKGRSILMVSDRPGFLKYGGMIGFVTKNNKIGIQINPESTKAAALIVSSKLLRVAEVITMK